MSIGEVIKKRRAELRLTQAALSQASGVATTLIARYELGEFEPKDKNAKAIADALEISVDELLSCSIKRKYIGRPLTGSDIHQMRLKRSLTVMEFADIIGVNPDVVRRWERTNMQLSARSQSKVMKFYNSNSEKALRYAVGATPTLGRCILLAREQKGLTQLELGRTCGISRAAISCYERNKQRPPVEKLRKLGEILGVDLLKYFNRKDES